MWSISKIDMRISDAIYKWEMARQLGDQILASAGYAYIIEFSDGVKKVGWAKNLVDRMYVLSRQLDENFVLRYVISSDRAYELERQLHREIRSRPIERDRTRGDEYYKMSDSDVSEILDFIASNHESFDVRSEGRSVRRKSNRVESYKVGEKYFVKGRVFDGRITMPMKVRSLFNIADGDEIVLTFVKKVEKCL